VFLQILQVVWLAEALSDKDSARDALLLQFNKGSFLELEFNVMEAAQDLGKVCDAPFNPPFAINPF